MKTQLFLTLTLITALFCTSCSEDSGLVQSLVPGTEGSENLPPGDQASLADVTLDFCIDIESTHRLNAYLRNEPMRSSTQNESDPSQTAGRSGDTETFYIRASGEGSATVHNSEDASGKSTVQVSMYYDTGSGRVSGSVTTQLNSGDVVTQYMDGLALVQGDREFQSIKVNLVSGQAAHNGDHLSLINGYLVIGLPAKLTEGWIETNLYTTSMFCTGASE